MEKFQVAAAVTLDRFLPDKEEKVLWEWMNSNSNGFPFWRKKCSFNLFPEYSMIDILAHLDSFAGSYYAEIHDTNITEMLRKLAYFNLINEFVLYIAHILW